MPLRRAERERIREIEKEHARHNETGQKSHHNSRGGF